MPYIPPGYDPITGLNTGNLGFTSLPVEKTVGGFQNNIWNPNANPYPGGWKEEYADQGMSPDINPFLQGKFDKNGAWHPLLPDKIVYGQSAGGTAALGDASHTIGGQTSRFTPGGPIPAQRGPEYSAPAVSSTTVPSGPAGPSGFHFGEVGQPGYKFMPGDVMNGKFFSAQPDTLKPGDQKDLGVLKPWNPALNALQQSRSQP